jgi:hypothetical protein
VATTLSSDVRLAVALCGFWLICFGFGSLSVREALEAHPSTASSAGLLDPQEVINFVYREHGLDDQIRYFRASRLAVLPRKFLFFNIHSINEIRLDDARIDVNISENGSNGAELVPLAPGALSVFEGSSSYEKLGLVTGASATDLVISISEGSVAKAMLTAQGAEFDADGGKTKFLFATLENADGSTRIRSKSIFWSKSHKAFLIPGPYTARSAKGRGAGRGIKVDLDFKVAKL